MTNFGDKAIGFVLGVSVAASICAALIFTQSSVSWFELVKALSAILVASAFVITAASYVRQGEWKKHEDDLEDSKIYMEAALQGIQHAAEKTFNSTKGVDWHAATIYFEQSQIVAKNINALSVQDVFNLRKSVHLNEVLVKTHATDEHSFSNLSKAEYAKIRKKVRDLDSRNVNDISTVDKEEIRVELVGYADSLKGSNAIDFSSVVEICIGMGLFEHKDVFETKLLSTSLQEISPDYMDDDVIEISRKFLEKYYSTSSLRYYSETLFYLSKVMLKLGSDRRGQLIGN